MSATIELRDEASTAALSPLPVPEATTRRHIRGSTLLLSGRMISLVINFLVQVITVRLLSKSDYGAFAYALALVALGSSLTTLGLDKGVGRFVPIFHEQRDYRRMFATMLLALGAILATGSVLVASVLYGQTALQRVVPDEGARSVLVVLIALAPLEALDKLFAALTTSFVNARAVFVRRHLLGPGLKLVAVLMLCFQPQNPRVLAVGYVLAGALGVAAYARFLYQELKSRQLWQYCHALAGHWPGAELLRFSLPLLMSELVSLLRGTVVVCLLGYFHAGWGVAEFRAVLPVAGLNKVVFESFQFLFMPLAARMFARHDTAGINQLYWQSALWITMFSLPVFLVSFSLAEPLTVLLFGARYEDSAIVLTLLSFGQFFNAMLGFNALTLRVFGHVRVILINDALAVLGALLLSALLIPTWGPLGGAIASCGTLVLHNVLNQVALLKIKGISLFPAAHTVFYAATMLAAVGLLATQWWFQPPLWAAVAGAAALTASLFWFNRHSLELESTFPELQRVPVVKYIVGLTRT